ncbi:MAG: DUF4340 domain-containing protein [Bacteroidota bacterium]
MKKNRLILLITIVLLIIAVFFVLNEYKGKPSDKDFAVEDTSLVTKFFLTDKQNNCILLKKNTPGYWTLNDSLIARNDGINILLKTMKRLEVKEPVSKTARENVMKRIATVGVKVEIYQTVFRIDFFGLKLFPHEKLVKTYYVGDQTQSMMGTYMIIEDAEQPYIMHIPGFNGFLSSRYSTLLNDWRDHTMFNVELANIQSVNMEFPSEPGESYKIENTGNTTFTLTPLSVNKQFADYDTLKLLDFLAAFRDIKYEAIITNEELHNKDSILSTTPYHILSITDLSGNKSKIKTFHKKANEGEVELDGTPTLYDKDRLYALFNNGKDFALIQFYVFDSILRPLSYFLKAAETAEKR